ncbi:hypothetical protein WG8_0262, partial [Paenibacillus sp. Aloe-11]
ACWLNEPDAMPAGVYETPDTGSAEAEGRE